MLLNKIRFTLKLQNLSHYLTKVILTPILIISFIITLGFKNIEYSAGTDAELYEYVKKFHGSICTGVIIGVRLGLAARTALKLKDGEKVKARFFSRSCAVDGIQLVAGATYGSRDLEVEDRQDNRLILTSVKSKRQVETRLTRVAAEKAQYSLETKKKIQTLPKDSPERQRLELELSNILDWFRSAPEIEVVEVKNIK